MATNQPKSFWNKPEGKTGALFLVVMLGLLGWVGVTFGKALIGLAASLIGKIAIFGVLGVLILMALDGRTRNLIGYMYQLSLIHI